jgi:hypothetical protein
VIWRAFRKASPLSETEAAWWRDADAAALAASVGAIRGLRERLAYTDAELPVLHTQHRVIGSDRCHFVAPASLAGDVDVPGKLFLTSQRVVFAGGRAQSWPWHRVRNISRQERSLVLQINGTNDGLRLNCNSYGDAIIARYVASRLRGAER